jgi:hypothetical protein
MQDSVEWPEPTERTPLRVNPPSFRWPGREPRGRYTVELARSPEFGRVERAEATGSFCCPMKPLAPSAVAAYAQEVENRFLQAIGEARSRIP